VVVGLILSSIVLLMLYLPNKKLPDLTAALETTPTLSSTTTSPPTQAKQETQVKPTQTLTPIPTSTTKPTLVPSNTNTPTPVLGVVSAQNGAVIRAEPDFSAPVVTYVNDGGEIYLLNETQLSGQYLWISVMTEGGEQGWMLGSLVQTATPTP